MYPQSSKDKCLIDKQKSELMRNENSIKLSFKYFTIINAIHEFPNHRKFKLSEKYP